MYIKDDDQPNIILKKQFSPKGNILGQSLMMHKSAKRLFPERSMSKRLTKEKRLRLLLNESDSEEIVNDEEIMNEFIKSVHIRRDTTDKL